MKNAKVLEDHFGDDGHVTAGRILRRISAKRFDALEKSGLVREATAKELEAGDDLGFVPESERNEGGGKLDLDVLEGSAFHKLLLEKEGAEARILTLTADLAARDDTIKQLTDDLGDRDATIVTLNDDLSKLQETYKAEMEKKLAALDEATKRASDAEAALDSASDGQGGNKQKSAPSNKKAADPANKGA